ncbi:MAG: ParB/RepB/Spo0J family partition protein [Pseudobdellovibrionaceae bacterium]
MSDLSNENQNKKQRLGRGLGSLLGGHQSNLGASDKAPSNPKMNTQSPSVANQVTVPASAAPAVPAEARVWQVPVDKLSPSQFQPRTHFEKEKLEELASSIKQNGILQPIVARKLANGKFEIIAGERRWRAAQIAGLHEVPVLIKTLENQAALEIAIIENIQREDLNPIEEAEAYQRLAQEFHLTQQQVAEKVGKERATVANSMRLLALPQQIRQMVIQDEISAGHAKVLLSLANPAAQLELAKKISQQKLSVRQLEKLVAAEAAGKKTESETSATDHGVTQRLIAGLSEELQKVLGTKVSIDYLNSKGRISIQFYSDEELTQIVDRLKASHGRH